MRERETLCAELIALEREGLPHVTRILLGHRPSRTAVHSFFTFP
jgi:hypothetical protein